MDPVEPVAPGGGAACKQKRVEVPGSEPGRWHVEDITNAFVIIDDLMNEVGDERQKNFQTCSRKEAMIEIFP
ncbi:hypothetical protein TNCV_1947121 [Trichonephila clavipes]|nr:hypothetical protein TNCV_1947121 [Trichonephila clavipes]